MKQMQQKKAPERKCMGCNEKKSKRDMLRVVRTPEGEICADSTGKKSGRGVYICYNCACLERVKKSGRFQKCLEAEIPDSIYTEIEQIIKEAIENDK